MALTARPNMERVISGSKPPPPSLYYSWDLSVWIGGPSFHFMNMAENSELLMLLFLHDLNCIKSHALQNYSHDLK